MLQPAFDTSAPPPPWVSVQHPERTHVPHAATPSPVPHDAAISPTALAFTVVAMLRAHPHLSNVLTHISRGNWSQVEQALGVILNPDAHSTRLSPLARNIVDLMCADQGVTGRMFKPYYQDLLTGILGKSVARRLIANVTSLYVETERAIAQPACATSTQSLLIAGTKPDEAGSKN